MNATYDDDTHQQEAASQSTSDANATDPRLKWLSRLVRSLLNVDEAAFIKLLLDEHQRARVESFLDMKDVMRLMFFRKDKELVAVLDPSEHMRERTAYFVKRQAQVLTTENIDDEVLTGDLTEPLQQLLLLSKSIVLPLILNPSNSHSMPKAMLAEATAELHRFVANAEIEIGRQRGETVLPLPFTEQETHGMVLPPVSSRNASPGSPLHAGANLPGGRHVSSAAPSIMQRQQAQSARQHQTTQVQGMLRAPVSRLSDRNPKDVELLESAVVTWQQQVEAALNIDPDAALKAKGQHPGPDVEIKYWTDRSRNLTSMSAQLASVKTRQMCKALEMARSSYAATLCRIVKDVDEAKAATLHTVLCLQPLEGHLLRLAPSSVTNFMTLPQSFGPFFRVLLLTWRHAVHWAVPSRLTALMRETVNDVLTCAAAFLPGAEAIQMEPAEALLRLKMTAQVLQCFKNAYLQARQKSSVLTPAKPWHCSIRLIFGRLDAYLTRLDEVYVIVNSASAYLRLEKIEIGGTHGHVFTDASRKLHAEFIAVWAGMLKLEYDMLSLEAGPSGAWAINCSTFLRIIHDMDKRLGHIVFMALSSCKTMVQAFAVFDSFDSNILERSIIAKDVARAIPHLISAFRDDIAEVSAVFRAGKSQPVVARNASPVAGALTWAESLRQRILGPMVRLKAVSSVATSGMLSILTDPFDKLLGAIKEYEQAIMSTWCAEISVVSSTKLKQPLLRWELQTCAPGHVNTECRRKHILQVNFDPALTALLREVRGLQMVPSLSMPIPQDALLVAERGEHFCVQVANLELLCSTYNAMQQSALELQLPLFAVKTAAAEASLRKGVQGLTWNTHHIDDYIMEATSSVYSASTILRVLQSNEAKMHAILKAWRTNVMFERKEQKVYRLPELQTRSHNLLASRQSAISIDAAELCSLLRSSHEALEPAPAANAWQDYVTYISQTVAEGTVAAVLASTAVLQVEVTAARQENRPLLEIELRLAASAVVFYPALVDEMSPDITGIPIVSPVVTEPTSQGLKRTVEGMFKWLLQEFSAIGNLVTHVDGIPGTFASMISQDFNVIAARNAVLSLVSDCTLEAVELAERFQNYEMVWARDAHTNLQEFLAANSADDMAAAPQLSLEAFEAEIARYCAVQDEVAALPATTTVGILRIDCRPARTALATCVANTIAAFTKYLESKVVVSMAQLFTFMDHANSVLDRPVGPELGTDTPRYIIESNETAQAESTARRLLRAERTREGLYAIMSAMRDVRARESVTEAMFGPLHGCVALLQKYGIMVADDVLAQMEAGPQAWKSLQKKMNTRKLVLAPLQICERADIKLAATTFATALQEFRTVFKNAAPFSVSDRVLTLQHVNPAYEAMDALHHGTLSLKSSITEFLIENERLREQQEMFELAVQDSTVLSSCLEELAALKALWDVASNMLHSFTDWQSTLWQDVETDTLMEMTRTFAKDIKLLPKAVRAFDVYRLLEDAAKAMATALPLIQELRHPAMRHHHWQQLMKATGKRFSMGQDFSLGDLLRLQLHVHAEACAEIVDRAQKEQVIEKALRKISDTWNAMQLTFTPYKEGSDVWATSIDDAVAEALENDNVALQNLSSSKYVQGNAGFQEQVSTWLRKIGTVDLVLAAWADVQRRWANLESIFVGSLDIRSQLPADSARFDAINTDFQDLMREAPAVKNVVDACMVARRADRLDSLLEQLEQCQKALQDYLETKRLAFPRFYFVAPADLLDIVSKGSTPQAIMRHLPKCFDNMHNLEFRKSETGENTKAAIGMYSGENEFVAFTTVCVCDGPVEVWLQKVVDAMRSALAAEMKAAISTYETKPRAQWIFESSVQSTIVASRLFFTADVFAAFDDLEDGNEDALKAEYEKQVLQLSDLITIINGELSKNDRKKLITLCTIDVHARDVLSRLIEERVESGMAFQWQSQLRYSQSKSTQEVQVEICDAEMRYGYEYIGNCGCLCITPLTDRCVITLTQAQRLMLGGAPAGPAGTGKTETTKDLARALGVQCYVFNCSDQMDYKAMGQVYKGLAQTGAWGCFDEFNRIPVAVLSVCSTQYKMVLDALRARKARFCFEGTDIQLRTSVMAFITMNPGYPGRAELPESLKALFRPVSMCVPDLALICEIMLMAEGFQTSKVLSRKFVILYKLCEDLLSKARHYDWKLRAIKTTLYVAGGMKRAAPDLTEEKVLLRALRDFNLGKLTSDDEGIFRGLLDDLFPGIAEQVPRAVDLKFEAKVKEAALDLGFQAEDSFRLKVSQLREILEVRWSVFLLGPAGCGKTAMWRTLLKAQNDMGEKTIFRPFNPKAVMRNELYGYIHPLTREWKEGLLSVTFREFSNNKTNKHQWIVLDGDIDAEWIESMNTVMDDNKILTLASNERIPLTHSMRLLLEINHMNHCSPATVSRGGVIFVNADDIGWKPVVDSWVQSREAVEYRPILTALFARYLEPALEFCRSHVKTLVHQAAVTQAETVCSILDAMIPQEVSRGAPPPDKKLIELQFVFAVVWALGGCLLADKATDHRAVFSSWWIAENKYVPYPDKGSIFDYYVDENAVEWVHWDKSVPDFHYVPDQFASLFVPTAETTRLAFLANLLMNNQHCVMFIGNTGTGKTAVMREVLRGLNSDVFASVSLNMNSFSDASAVQLALEQPLEKKSGARYGPPGGRHLVYFVDDMNMPLVDKYDTQSAIELVRQAVDYHGWYDKHKILLKEVFNVQFAACMNPTAGSFSITPRMQRHFATFALQMPGPDVVRCIYTSIVGGHLACGNFTELVTSVGQKLVDASIELHHKIMTAFLPSAIKFHYQFNLRELSALTQGICRMTNDKYTKALAVVRLWAHEADRVFSDRLVNDSDKAKYNVLRDGVCGKHFHDLPMDDVVAKPLLVATFLDTSADDVPLYTPVLNYEQLKTALETTLSEYNESNAVMDLVLFEQAMEHVCRITRIISQPQGNAMLVGVGGSGKQSLARLAAYICGYEVFQISVTASYGIPEFKEDLLALYAKAGSKGQGVVLLMTDNQVVNERFLVYINDLLSTGFIADLCTPEDKDNFCNAVRSELKQAGVMDTPDNCWDFFVNKVRKYLHVVLCFSPVGDKFRVRARQFPALVNCMVYDWFLPWPSQALVSVAARFLIDVSGIDTILRDSIAQHMAFTHQSVLSASARYLETVRRHVYVTPKSYLELIALYKSLLAAKREELNANRQRLESGIDKIAQASQQVAELQVMLAREVVVVEQKKAATQALIASIGQEKTVVDEAVNSSRADEEEAAALSIEVSAFQAECASDLEVAEPVIQAAEKALNSLDKASLGELKSFGSPSAEVVAVLSACMVLCAAGGKIPKDLSWNAGKKFMGNVDTFLKSLISFDKDNVCVACVDKAEKDYISNLNFTPDVIKSKSGAAAGLCSWVINICKYYRIYQVVAPKRIALAEANKKLDNANKKLTSIRTKVKDLNDRVAALEADLMKATEDKNIAVAQADKTAAKAALAERLISNLVGENRRWTASIESFKAAEGNLVGDALLAAAFVSYAGPFTTPFRVTLAIEQWLPDLVQRGIPLSTDWKPLSLIADDRSKAVWATEGLQGDTLSMENGAIIQAASRWPLLIDPQLQGVRWIMKREEPNGLVIIQQGQPKYLDKVTKCIEDGIPLLIENMPENIEPVLDPVIGKRTFKRGRLTMIKVGDAEIEFNPKFRLYLQTKLANPHFIPEVAAQTTLVNFCVTEAGLEDQLLSQVVAHERADLQEQADTLSVQLSSYTITLTGLEDNLLARLAASTGDILEDVPLIENLEETKTTANNIAEKVKQAKLTEVSISTAREVYRPVAARGSLLYFLIDSLSQLDRVYHFSMAAFVSILCKGMDQTPGAADESAVPPELRAGRVVDTTVRIASLVQTTTSTVFAYVAQGLFERHKLIVSTQLCMSILRNNDALPPARFEFLVSVPKKAGSCPGPLADLVSEATWQLIAALMDVDGFASLAEDMASAPRRWQEWLDLERPEDEPLPGDWKRVAEFDKLLLFRVLRPDRLTAAMSKFVASSIGPEFIASQPFDLERSFQDTSAGTPIMMFLAPGVDVAAAVEALGRKLGFTLDNGKYASVSLGQGQEPIAMSALENGARNGGWVLLQNIHLTIDWTTGSLDKRVDKLADGAHPDFRLFLSGEAPPALERPLPISLLQTSIKLTNEPPDGLKFSEDFLEGCSKQAEFRAITFGLAYFHAAMLERKKFGVGNFPGATSGIGWNMNYPFNTGDLLCCGQCANNYLDNNTIVPWEDLRYIFGEIMYGGHIVEDWDRRLCSAYLARTFTATLLDAPPLFPGFLPPTGALTHKQVMAYIDEEMPPETPLAFGLHPNAEIGFKLREGMRFCSSIAVLHPQSIAAAGGLSTEERAKVVLDELLEKLPDQLDLADIRARVDELTPYVMVALQESERMVVLITLIRRNLAELDLGLKGDLTMSEPMERLANHMAEGSIPPAWAAASGPSLRLLSGWLDHLRQRAAQLSEWTTDLTTPHSVWLPGLFNPQSFLTAVMQSTARKNGWPLDQTVLVTEVTKRQPSAVDAPAKDGAFIHGLWLEGARWDEKSGHLEESKAKELLCAMPVMLVRAVPTDKAEARDTYACPVYSTEARFRQEVFTANIRSKAAWTKWTLAGAAMFLDVAS